VTIPLKSSKDANAATAAAAKIDATISFFILNLPDPVSFMREVYQTLSGLCNHKPTPRQKRLSSSALAVKFAKMV
jgi:hypothetical protein